MPSSCEAKEIIKGRLLWIRVQYEHVTLVFVNLYAPINRVERVFLNALWDTISGYSSDEYLFMGGDFTCTEQPHLDKNHQEPYPPSSRWQATP